MKLEYVGSGTSYMRLSNPSLHDRPEIIALVNKMFHHFFDDQPGHTFSLLYNAWAESNFGPRLSNFKESMHQLHADSGGLQMVTLAHKIPKGTDKNVLREEVYQDQSKWADVGMCFDEIPVITTGASDRNDTSNRYFDRENRHKYAKQTAENVKRQIEVFKANNSKCKPFMICQGGDLETYLEWIDTILETVPKEDHNRIGGVAMGGAGLGTGPLEDIQKAFFATQVPLRDENGTLHLHILGVGAISRMIPYLIFLQNGLYGDNVHVSYDSTTHTRAVETGLYYMLGEIGSQGEFVPGEGATMKFNRARASDAPLYGEARAFVPTSEYRAMYADIQKYWPLSMTFEKFHEVLNTPSIPYLEKYGQLDEWYEGRTAMCCGSIKNFMIQIEDYVKNKEPLMNLAMKKYGGKNKESIEKLFEVKDVESFDAWMKDCAANFKANNLSKSISHVAPSEIATLEALFG